MSLLRCRVVLVRPHFPGNIGAAARAMHNMGLRDLALVAPVADPLDPQALQLSTHGEFILRDAKTYGSLADALADRVFVVGSSARHGGLFRRQTVGQPDQILPAMAAELAADRPTALVFGPEPTGLADAEVSLCHRLIVIPTDDANPSLNLAQAVAICLYELRRAWIGVTPSPAESEEGPRASVALQERMFAKLREALERIHFLYGEKADPLMHGIRHLLGKAHLTESECRILMGMARQIGWQVRQTEGQGGRPDAEANEGTEN